MTATEFDAHSTALLELGRALLRTGYEFVSVTPETHRRVLARDASPARHLRDVFGWNKPCAPELLPAEILRLAQQAGVLIAQQNRVRASARFSTLSGRLFVHSSYPTLELDAVFFGPDTYRFCNFVKRQMSPCQRLVDVGCGSGAGGLSAAPLAERIVLADINPAALRLARVNAALAGTPVEVVQSDVLAAVDGPIDLVIANPPYMRDTSHRLYRDGGGQHGEALSLRIVREALARLSRGGTLLLYTGAPIVDGKDLFGDAVGKLCQEADASFEYEELDPDVFGEQLEQPSYEQVERIAAVGLKAVLR